MHRGVRLFMRFGIGGAINTLLTYLIFLVLVSVIDYRAAYTVVFAAGIVLSYWINASFVFKSRHSRARIAKYCLVYLSQYLAGLLLLYVFVDTLRLPSAVAMLLVIGITAPITFVLLGTVLDQRSA
jgi:putative flippase GtrA